MNKTDFEKVYDAMAKPLDNRHIPVNPFGPILVKILLEEDDVFIIGSLPRSVMLPYFTTDEGVAHLDHLIAEIIAKQGDDFYVLKAYECHTKLIKVESMEAGEALKDKRLNQDPAATHCIAMILYHKTGKRMGVMEIDTNRVAHYAPLLPDDTQSADIKVNAKPLQ